MCYSQKVVITLQNLVWVHPEIETLDQTQCLNHHLRAHVGVLARMPYAAHSHHEEDHADLAEVEVVEAEAADEASHDALASI